MRRFFLTRMVAQWQRLLEGRAATQHGAHLLHAQVQRSPIPAQKASREERSELQTWITGGEFFLPWPPACHLGVGRK